MAELKTKPTDASVDDFLAAIADDKKRADAQALVEMFADVTGEQATMWGNIVGFGSYDYKYASGRGGTWFRAGFSPRKRNLTLYIMPGFDSYERLLGRLGKHKHGKSCLYVNKLADVDVNILRDLVTASVAEMDQKYPRAEA